MAVDSRSVLLNAALSFCAVLGSFAFTYALAVRFGAGSSPAVLAAALALGLMRRPDPPAAKALVLKLVSLPLVALAAGLIGLSLVKVPPAGAAIFSCGVALSVWLRGFGRKASAIGRTIALPLMSILVVPVHFQTSAGKALGPLLILAAGAIAFVCTAGASQLGAALHVAPEAPAEREQRPPREGTMPVATRMALQMLTALALAFTFGMTLFPAHWPWVVLTAFIVCSGAIGRGDAIHKAILRLGGATAGTIAASLIAQIVFPNPPAYAAAVFVVLFLGIWLRQINYAYWAGCATLIFALLQGTHGTAALAVFGARIACMLIGAVCAIAATWFVYPIRTEQVVRRRVANALKTLNDVLKGSPGDPEHSELLAALKHHAAELERVAPPVRLHRLILGARSSGDHPASLIEQTHALLAQAGTPNFDRAHVGAELRRLAALLRAKQSIS